MFSKNKKVRIACILAAAIIALVAFRIFSNIIRERERAERMSQSRAVAVELSKPSRQTIIPKLYFTGSLDPDWQADVAAKVDGRLEKVYVNEGDHVTKGQVLAVLEQVDTDADLLNARGSYLDAEATLRKTESDLKRYQKLYEEGAVSAAERDNYSFARDNAYAKLEAARGVLAGMESKSAGTVLAAPADGIIAKRYYQEGYYATAATPVFSVADISKLKIIIHVPEGNISSVAVGNEAEITLPAYQNKKITGRITRIAPVADQPSHMFSTEVSVDNPEGMRAGVYARVTLTAEPKVNALTVPLKSIIMRDDQKTIFIPDADGVVTRRVLEIGYSDGDIAEVLRGLKDDETIVVGGHNKLREGSVVKLEKADSEK